MSFGGVTLQNPVGFLTPFGPRKINTIPLDVVIEEDVMHSVVVTKHPVEIPAGSGSLGGEIADSAYLEPIEYSMVGAVSNYPVSWRVFEDRYGNSTSKSRSISAYELLVQHLQRLVPFTLETPVFGDMENMLFTFFHVNRNKSTKGTIIFDAKIHQLQVVTPDPVMVERTADQVSGEQAETQAVGETKRGNVGGTEVPASSVLGERFGGIFGGGA